MKYTVQLIVGLILLNGFMYWQQASMTFFPHANIQQTPQAWGLTYDDVTLTASDGVRLHGWFIPHANAKSGNIEINDVSLNNSKPNSGTQKTLLFFHGNAGNISHRRSSIEIFHRLGLNVFIIGYRGYGNSEGQPDEQGLYKDARAAWDYLIQQRDINANNIIVFGRSLGGAVAAQLAAEVQPGALILESTFSSARDMANAIFPVLSRLIFLRYDFNTVAGISQVTSPVLILHSPDDEIVPISLGKNIYQAANQPKSFSLMRGGHNDGLLMSQPEYEQVLKEFIYAAPNIVSITINNTQDQ